MAELVNIKDLTREEWHPIPGFENEYLINKSGDVLSLPRNGTVKQPKILKQYIDRYGYKKIVLRKNDEPHYHTIHRLLAITFIPNPENLATVNHKNSIKTDNRIENLEWLSNEDNLLHSFIHGKQRYKMQAIKVTDLNNGEVYEFESHKKACKALGLHQGSFSRALKRSSVFKNYRVEAIL